MTLLICNQNIDVEENPVFTSLEKDDAVLLIESGTLLCLNNIQTEAALFVLEEDLAARGLSENCQPAFKKVSYDSFVELTEKHQKIISL